jgi:hypothetical protein
VLAGHEPYPAIAVDRHWTLVASNRTIAPLVAGADPELLRPPVNILRLGLHPDGIAPRIINFPEWRAHLIALPFKAPSFASRPTGCRVGGNGGHCWPTP